MEKWIKELVKKNSFVDFTTISPDNIPFTIPMISFYKDGYFFLTASVVLSNKFENIKLNNRIAILFSNNENEVIVNGTASIDDSNLDLGWQEYRDSWFKLDPHAARLYANKDDFPNYWKRVIIKVRPRIFLARKISSSSELRYEMEII